MDGDYINRMLFYFSGILVISAVFASFERYFLASFAGMLMLSSVGTLSNRADYGPLSKDLY